jgi:hypothetical protein
VAGRLLTTPVTLPDTDTLPPAGTVVFAVPDTEPLSDDSCTCTVKRKESPLASGSTVAWPPSRLTVTGNDPTGGTAGLDPTHSVTEVQIPF